VNPTNLVGLMSLKVGSYTRPLRLTLSGDN